MNSLEASEANALLSVKESESFKKRWFNFIDSGLHLFLDESKVKKVWRFLYRYNLWRFAGIGVGSLIMTASMQQMVTAQIADTAETEINNVLSPYLNGVDDFVTVVFGTGRLLLFVFGLGLIVYGIYDGISNRGSNWHIWAGIGSTLAIGVVLVSIVEKAVFG